MLFVFGPACDQPEVVQKQLPRIFRDDEYKAPGPAPALSLIAHLAGPCPSFRRGTSPGSCQIWLRHGIKHGIVLDAGNVGDALALSMSSFSSTSPHVVQDAS